MVDQKRSNNYWDNRKQKHLNMPSTIPKTDYLKVLVLFSLLAVCFYSALQKFVFVGTESYFEIKPDFSACSKYEKDAGKLKSCQDTLLVAYATSGVKCKGFISQYDTCKKAKQSRCHTEQNNVEGCINAIIKPYLEQLKESS